MLHTYPGLTPFNIGKLTMRKYNALLNQAFNLKNFDLNGKLDYETPSDQRKRVREEWKDEIDKLLEGGK